MPLVDHSNDVFSLDRIKISKDPLISLINQYLFLFGCYFVQNSNKEIDAASIDRLRKSLSSPNMKSIDEIVILSSPAGSYLSSLE
jgi:hypothetical protein